VLAIVMKRRPWAWVLSHSLHFVMSVAMLVMAWPWGARLPPTGPTVFFALAAMTFVALAGFAARRPGLRVRYVYQAVMMLGTGWMFAIMSNALLPARSGTHDTAQPAMSAMPGMAASGTNPPASGGAPMWFNAINWLGTVGFAVAALIWAYWYFAKREQDKSRFKSLGNLSQAGMAIGMAVLFSATLFRV